MAAQTNYADIVARAYQLQAERQAQQAADAETQQAELLRQRDATRSRTFGEVAQDVGLQLTQGVVGLGQALYGAGNLATLGLLDRGAGISRDFAETNQILQGAKSAPTQARAAEAQRAFDEEGVAAGLGAYVTSPALLQDLVVSNAPSLIPGVAVAGRAGRVAAAATTGLEQAAASKLIREAATTAAVRTAGAQTAGATNVDAINAIRDAGGGEDLQQFGGVGAGLLAGLATPALSRLTGAGALEAAAANALNPATRAAFQTGAGGVARGVAGGFLREGTEEAAQSSVEQLAQNLFAPGVDLGQGVGQAAALGGLAGGLLGGGLGAVSSSPRQSSGLRDQIESTLNEFSAEQAAPDAQGELRGLRGVLGRRFVQPVSNAPVPEPTGLNAAMQRVRAEQAYVQNLPNMLPEINSDTGPLPYDNLGEVQTDVGLPTPDVEELTGARAAIARVRAQAIPQMQVEELPVETVDAAAAPRTGSLLDAIASTRARQGQLGGTDLLGGPLADQGAFFRAAEEPGAAPVLAQVPAEVQPPLPFDRPIPSWKSFLAKDLGLKAANFRGAAWTQFEQAAAASGIRPTDPGAVEFLRQVGGQLGADEARAPLFAAKLAERYAAQPPVPAMDANGAAEQPALGAAPEAAPSLEQQVVDQVESSVEQVPRVTNVKQVRSGYADEGTYYEVAMDDGRSARVYRQAGDGGVQLSGWYYAPEGAERGVYLGETRKDALDALPRALGTNSAALAPVVGEIDNAVSQRAADLQDLVDAEGQGKNNLVPAARRVLADSVESATTIADLELLRQASEMVQSMTRLSPAARRTMFEDRAVKIASESLSGAPDTDQLDAVYNSLIQTEAFKALPQAKQDELVNTYSQSYDRFELGKFSRAEAPVTTPLKTETFAELVANASRLGTPVVAHDNVAAFKNATGHTAPADANGVYIGDQLHLIRQNIGSAKELAMVLAHERGHQGLAGLLGDRLPAVTNRLWANAALRKRIKGKMDTGLDRSTAAEEVLADMLAGGERLTGDVTSKLRAGVDNLFAKIFGYSKYQVPSKDVDTLLKDTVAYQRARIAGQGSAIDPNNPLTNEEAMAELDRMLGDPGRIGGQPLYSRALDDIQTAIAGANGTTSPRTLQDGVKAAYDAGKQTAKGIGESFTVGGVFSRLLDAVPLNQMNNLYGDLLSDGDRKPLADFARFKRAKEATYNKTLTEDRPVKYGSEQFNTGPMSLAQEWDKFARDRSTAKKAEALNTLQQNATLYRVFPDRKWSEQSDLNYNDFSFTEAERKAAHAKLSELYTSLGKTGQELYKKSQGVYSDLWNRRFEALANELSRVTGAPRDSELFKQQYGRTIDTALNKMRTGPYSPLQRYGDYLVTVRDKQGKIAWFSGHESAAEADAVAAQLRKGQYASTSDYKVNRTVRQKFDWNLDGINDATIKKLEGSVDAALPNESQAQLRNELRKGLVEAYLQSLPQQSFLQHANVRKGVEGATADAFRAFNDYSTKAARNIAALQYDGQISNKLTELQQFVTEKAQTEPDSNTSKMQQVVNAIKTQHAASLRAEQTPIVDWLTQAGFVMYMTSPSQMFINAMQTPMVAIPRLVGKYGTTGALRAFKGALDTFVRSRGNMLGARSTVAEGSLERQVLDQLQQRGVLDFTQAHDLTGLARGDNAAMSGHWRTAMNVMSLAMNKSEVFNRQVTAYAAAQLEAQKLGLQPGARPTPAQLAQITDAAEDAVYDTQFDYSQSNKPTIMQGPLGKLALQFQQYRFNMLAMIAKDIRDSFTGTPEEKATARRTLAWTLGMQAAFAGAAGTVLSPIAFAIADAFRDDDDLLDSQTEFARSVPQWLSHGLLSGALDTSRLSAATLIPYFGDKEYEPKDATAKEVFQYHAMRNLGPWLGLGAAWSDGAAKMLDGDVAGALKSAAPKPFADALKAYTDAGGAKDARQVSYFDPNVWDTVTAAVGLKSGSRAEAEETRGATYEATKRISTVKQRYLNQLAIGQSTGDRELVQEAMAKIQAWNASVPDQAIKAQDIRRATVRQARSQSNADAFGTPLSLPPSPSVRAAVGI